MDDKFRLSLGQAQQIEFAFQRNNWNASDVHQLCKGDVLSFLKPYLHHEPPRVEKDNEKVSIPVLELSRLKEIEEKYHDLCDRVNASADVAKDILEESVRNIFTKQAFKQIGAPTNSVNSIVFVLGTHGIKKIGQLVRMSKSDLHYEYLGPITIGYIEAVLHAHGLRFGMFPQQ